MVYTVDFHPFSARNVLGMRAEGGLNCKIERKYERYLKDVTFTPIWYFRLVATMPKWGARLALKIADKHIGTMKKLRRKLIFDKRD